MNSGIYKLSFRSGRHYIGKSIHLDKRYIEHLDLMNRGKAASKMQEEYDKWGEPEMEIIMEAHPEHLDILEAYLIATFRPYLNTVVSNCISADDFKVLAEHPELIKLSTATIVRLAIDIKDEAMDALVKLEALQHKYNELDSAYKSKMYEQDSEVRLRNTEMELNQLRDLNSRLVEDLDKLIKPVPWWKRLF